MTEKDIDNAAVTRASKKTDSSEKTAAAKAKEKASGKTAAAKKPAASGKTTAAKKPAASGKTTAAKKPAAKKPAAAKKTSSALRLSAEEKKLIQNYRKCNSVAKMMITAAVEKAAVIRRVEEVCRVDVREADDYEQDQSGNQKSRRHVLEQCDDAVSPDGKQEEK